MLENKRYEYFSYGATFDYRGEFKFVLLENIVISRLRLGN